MKKNKQERNTGKNKKWEKQKITRRKICDTALIIDREKKEQEKEIRREENKDKDNYERTL